MFPHSTRPPRGRLARGLALRTRRGCLQTRIDTYRHNDGRTATVVGMIHVADPAFYDAVTDFVGERETGGAQVQYEGVGPPPPDTAITDHERGLIERLRKALNHRAFAGLVGLALQHDERLMIQDHWHNPDMNVVDFLRALPSPEKFISRQESVGRLLDGLNDYERHSIGHVLHRHTRYQGYAMRLMQTVDRVTGIGLGSARRVVTSLRDGVAADAIDAAPGSVVALWGAGHLPGIGERLSRRGWAYVGEEWLTAVSRREARHAKR
jgi:hypothetical protein